MRRNDKHAYTQATILAPGTLTVSTCYLHALYMHEGGQGARNEFWQYTTRIHVRYPTSCFFAECTYTLDVRFIGYWCGCVLFTLHRSVYPSSSSAPTNSVLERYKLCGNKTTTQDILHANAVSGVDNARIGRRTEATNKQKKMKWKTLSKCSALSGDATDNSNKRNMTKRDRKGQGNRGNTSWASHKTI